LALVDLTEASLAEAQTEAAAAGAETLALAADVASEEDWIGVIAAVATRFGRLNALINNAGVSGPVAPLHEVSVACFDHVLAVNLRGVFLGMKHARALLLATPGSSIVNVGSLSGLTGGSNTIAYTASKHAVTGITKLAANEFASHGVRVNAVCPAPTNTAMMQALAVQMSPNDPARFHHSFAKFIPLARYAEATEVAAAIVFLASPAAGFITGIALPVDGGVQAR
jgi:NAD(P)-dependent dehydrogenase (short-subunit alcohol dehydrogenase family)